MSLPEIIEIVPLDRPVEAVVSVPGSKSITNRALILAALSPGDSELRGALWSEDTRVMIDGLRRLGFEIECRHDPREPGNRLVRVTGRGGEIPASGTAENPVSLQVGNAGTAARFLSALVCLGRGVYRLEGAERMHERPQSGLFTALRQLGYRIEASGDRLPAVIFGGGPREASCRVDISESSQFASALLLVAPAGHWSINVVGETENLSPYVRMTRRLIQSFERSGGQFEIEPDASSGSYFLGADWLLAIDGHPNGEFDRIQVAGWPASDWQIDAQYRRLRHLEMPAYGTLSRRLDLADSILTAIVTAPAKPSVVTSVGGEESRESTPSVFTDLGRLRVQECERVRAMRDGLERCGARVRESGDTLTIWPSHLHGATIETHDDHRIAMCFAILGLKVPGIRIINPTCVRKTFPHFFAKLAAPPGRGLGVRIRDAASGQELDISRLEANTT